MKQHRLRRLFGACLGALALGVMAVPTANADHASPTHNDYYNGPQGPITLAAKEFCLTETLVNRISGAQVSEVRDRVEEVTVHVASQTDMNYDFDIEASGTCSNTLNFVDIWNDASGSTVEARMDSVCSGLGGGQSRITFADLDELELVSGVIGWTIVCDLNLNGFIDWQYIGLMGDQAHSCGGGYTFAGNPDCWKYDGTPNAVQWHFKGTFLHEFMHGIGFYGHFVSTGDACDSPKNTMCPGSNAFQGSTAGATLESHDIGETNENY